MDGRFTSRDTFAGYLNQSQSQNPFVYTENNPIRYTDPTGHYSWEDFVAEGRSLVSNPVQHTLAQIQKNRNMPWQCTDVGQIALWAAPAIAPLVVVAAIPVILMSPDSIIDLGFLIHDTYTGDSQAFALDAAALLIPGVTGLGMLSRADDAYDAIRYADEVKLGLTRYQQDMLIRNLDQDALIAVRPRKWGAYAWDGIYPAKGQNVHNTMTLYDSAGLDSGLRINLKDGSTVVSDLDIAGYTIKGMPVPEDIFRDTFMYRFNKEYGYNIITHGHFANGIDDVKVINRLSEDKILDLLEETIYLFDANGHRGTMKFWEYYSNLVIKVR